jgi:hypothetical protein
MDKAIWDTESLKNSLQQDHSIFDHIGPNSRGSKGATERVMFAEGGRVFFQSVTAYGSKMFLMECKMQRIGSKVTNGHVIQNFDWDRKASVMSDVECKLSIKVLPGKRSTAPIKPYRCSFGPVRVTVPHHKEGKVKATRKQRSHTDGPRFYDSDQFGPDGNILPSAPKTTKFTVPLDKGHSRSALFAFFACTFLGVRPDGGKRSAPDSGLRLHATMGTAVIFAFDWYHQGWFCISMEDEEERVVGQELTCHVRAHFYIYSRDIRYLPTSNLEETLEFLSCVAQTDAGLDPATRMVILDSLNTFIGDETDQDVLLEARTNYKGFRTQNALDKHCKGLGLRTQ